LMVAEEGVEPPTHGL